MTAVIHQPDFLPYLGFFQRLLHADVFIVLDQVQFLSGSKSWHNRDRIKTRQGGGWLTVPTRKAPQKTPINEILIADDPGWRQTHLDLMSHNYRKAPAFAEIFPLVEQLYSGTETRLVEFNLKSISLLMDLLGITIDMRMGSELGATGKSNELLVDILRRVNADRYLSGVGARDYFDPAPFEREGITVVWQQFHHPVYPQLHGPFVPYLSTIDLLFNCGIETARHLLRSC